MPTSLNLITAQISFLEGRFALIHIPLDYYPFFIQPIQRLLFGEDHDEDAHKIPWPYRHSFLNVSITPVECSIVCSRDLVDRFFVPLVDRFNGLLSNSDREIDHVQISPEDFDVIQVDGQGLDAGQRVLELTSPLAMAGISIFFETTYFSDYILVPHKSIQTVTQTLEQRGFTFSPSAAAYVSEHSPSSPISPRHYHNGHSSTDNPLHSRSGSDPKAPPSTPPASDITGLQAQTFTKLKRASIVPTVDRRIRLVSCAGRRETNPALDAHLRDDLLQILLATCPGTTPGSTPTDPYHRHRTTLDQDQHPSFSTHFLSLALTNDEPISLLLESSLLSNPNLSLSSTLLFSQSSSSTSNFPAGSAARGLDILIPITLDLRTLPLDATGIVCGVAGRLAQATSTTTALKAIAGEAEAGQEDGSLSPKTGPLDTSTSTFTRPEEHKAAERLEEGLAGEEGEATVVEISFLSTARAGTVIVRESELQRAVRALDVDVGFEI